MVLIGINSFIKDGIFVFTLTSNGYKYFTLNLVEHLKRVGVSWKLCIICADRDSQDFFSRQGIRTILAPTLISTGINISPFGTTNFQKLNRLKLDILAQCVSIPEIKYGVYMDGDIAVYSDFIPDVISRLANDKLIFQCDEQSRNDCSGTCINVCTGFIAWSHGSVSNTIFKVDANTLATWKKHPEDQIFINCRLREEGTPFKTFPRDLYPNGQFLSLHSGDSPLKRISKILHYNYTVGMDKQRRMRLNGDWLLPLI